MTSATAQSTLPTVIFSTPTSEVSRSLTPTGHHQNPHTRLRKSRESPLSSLLGINWSCDIVRGPLKAAALALRPRWTTQPTSLVPTTSGPPGVTLAPRKVDWACRGLNGSHRNLSIKPDWVVFDRELHKEYALDGIKVEKPVVDERLWPLEQVATYCRYGKTRYAFIVTQKELVALRVSALPMQTEVDAYENGTEWHHAAVEYASIPWDAAAADGLTVHLAIWVLGCMGLNDQHRDLVSPEAVARLTDWVQHRDSESGMVYYENLISKRRKNQVDWDPSNSEFVDIPGST